MKYDVFISCKSEDYKYAKQVYDFLVESNLTVFLCDAELQKSHKTMYGRVIEDAIDGTEHMIVFASKTEYVTSSYVEEEWRLFLEEKRSGRKSGNILTILKGVKIDSLPIGLRHRQSLSYSDFKNELLYYVKSDYQGVPEKNIDRNLVQQQKTFPKIWIISLICISVFVVLSSIGAAFFATTSFVEPLTEKQSSSITPMNPLPILMGDTLQNKINKTNGEVLKNEEVIVLTKEEYYKLSQNSKEHYE